MKAIILSNVKWYLILLLASLLTLTSNAEDFGIIAVTATSTPVHNICQAGDRIFNVRISPDDHFVLASNWRSGVEDTWKTRMWSLETGKPVHDFDIHTHNRAYTLSPNAVFSPDGNYIFTDVPTGTLMWNAKTGALIRELVGGLVNYNSVTYRFIPDSKELVISGNTGVEIWNIESGNRVLSLPDIKYELSSNQTVEVSSDGQYLLTYSEDAPYDAYLVKIKTGQRFFTFQGISSAIFSSNSLLAVTRSATSGIQLWDLQTLKVLYSLDELINVYDWKFSSDSHYFSIFSDQGFMIWDLESGQLIRNFPVFANSNVYGILPDDQHVLIPEPDPSQKIDLWDIASGVLVDSFQLNIEDGDSVSTFAFTSDSRHLVIATFQGTVEVWDINKDEMIYQFC